MSRKAQAAMEYLMTYGWAILIVIIVAAALYALGVFNPATWTGSRATGFTNLGAPASGAWLVSTATTDNFQLNLQNNLPSRIVVNSVTVTGVGNACGNMTVNTNALPYETPISIGGVIEIEGDCAGVTAGSYTATVTMDYNNTDTGLTGFKETGTLTGTVS